MFFVAPVAPAEIEEKHDQQWRQVKQQIRQPEVHPKIRNV
jgi:hypothetical protein